MLERLAPVLKQRDANLFLLVDQFEELFRFHAEQQESRGREDAEELVSLMLRLAEQRRLPVFVCLTVRSDFIGDCDRFQGLPEAMNRGQYLVPRLDRDQRREAIVGPVGMSGARIAPRLLDRLLNERLGTRDDLPILQHALMRMWIRTEPSDQSEGKRLTVDDYEAVGGLSQAISKHCDEVLEKLSGKQQSIAEGMFRCLCERGSAQRDTRRPTRVREIRATTGTSLEELGQVADAFRASGRTFLMPPIDAPLDDDTILDVSHESLIRQWGTLNDWVSAEEKSAEIYTRVEREARSWADLGKQPGSLWRSPNLDMALQWLADEKPTEAWARRYGRHFELAREFLGASERQQRVGEKARERELKRLEEAEQWERKRFEEAQQRALKQAQEQAQEQEHAAERATKYARRSRIWTSALFMITGSVLFVVLWPSKVPEWLSAMIAFAFFLFGAWAGFSGLRAQKITFGSAGIQFEADGLELTRILAENVKEEKLDQEVVRKHISYAETKTLSGTAAPGYSADKHPLTPMFLLDRDYRIHDWNDAFSLAFDLTMEGKQGRSIVEWTYHLDNFEEVLDHGETAFADSDNLPLIDVEKFVYTSLRYGRIEAMKHAYQIADDDGRCLAWLVTMDLDFENKTEASSYRQELLRLNDLSQLWSEYAIVYDQVWTNTRLYWDLIDALIGVKGPLRTISKGAKVLDMGAGTGNISQRLMDGDSKRTVFVLDNNREMLDLLCDKCADFLRNDDQGPGILVFKQDVTSLSGIPDDYFDCVISNNVFYALADPEASLESVFRVLKPSGELRMSGPRKDTDLDILFKEIRCELQSAGKFHEYKLDFEHVEQINKLLLKMILHKWTTKEFLSLLRKFGFKVMHSSEDVYAGQSMLVTASKPDKT